MSVSIAAIGDNVVDCYTGLGTMFPGGNCLNASVYAARFGATSYYVGAVGADAAGDLIRQTLQAEGVNTERLRVLPGATAWCRIGHRHGDRVFLDQDTGVSRFAPEEADLHLAATVDAVHVGQSSALDEYLGEFAARTRLSFDFSTVEDTQRIDRISPLCFLGSFSGGDRTPRAVEDLVHRSLDQGAQWALVTLGKHGALLARAGARYRCAAPTIPVLDTLGAGDTFASRVLVGLLAEENPQRVLAAATEAAAETCQRHGACGEGATIAIRPSPVAGTPATTLVPHRAQ